MTREEAIEKLLHVRRLVREIRESTDSPAVDSALRTADSYCFLAAGHLGHDTAICPEAE